jgi:RNase_H superfamily/YqaJ-like viral recombinase domain
MKITQRTPEWYKTRSMFIGATDVASLLNHGYDSPEDVVESKAKMEQIEKSSAAIQRGVKYEPYVKRMCEERNNFTILETPLQFHKSIPYLVASPDGAIQAGAIGVGHDILVEFKIRDQLEYCVPFKFWIQVQIQMEVFDIDKVLYCENKLTPSGELEAFYEEYVDRDRLWFERVAPTIDYYWSEIQKRRSNRKRPREREIQIDLKALSNHLLDDPIVDWLEKHESRDTPTTESTYSLKQFIKKKTLQFKDAVLSHFTSISAGGGVMVQTDSYLYPTSYKIIKTPPKSNRDDFLVERTKRLMDLDTLVISNAFLKRENMYGYVDFLVRTDKLREIFGLSPPSSDKKYCVVLVKYATLHLTVKGQLKSERKQNLYRCQIHFLANLLQPGSDWGCIIARKTDRLPSCQIKIVRTSDRELERIQAATRWIERLEMEDSKSWRFGSMPEMFPNMKQPSYLQERKLEIATPLDEVTLKYYHSVNNRDGSLPPQHAMDYVESFKMAEGAPGGVLNKEDLVEHFKASIPEGSRFFIDFEATSDLNDDFALFPECNGNALIFLIGCVSEDGRYTSYFALDDSESSEYAVVREWLADMDRSSESGQIVVFHWGDAEYSLISRACSRMAGAGVLDSHIQSIYNRLYFVDLCKMFKSCYFVSTPMNNYSLKTVASSLYKKGFISSTWSGDMNGADSMVAFWESLKRSGEVQDKIQSEIEKYNYIDCKVLHEIVGWLEEATSLVDAYIQ